jgi:mannose-6-phosphate isomerase-like protein (cupin superfamily)
MFEYKAREEIKNNKYYITDIENDTISNKYYRKVLHTATNMQLVLMSIKPGEEIGFEIHRDTDQFIRVESGKGLAILDNKEFQIKDGDAIVVNSGTEHNFINNSGTDDLKLYTIYTPPEHPDNTIEINKPVKSIESNNSKELCLICGNNIESIKVQAAYNNGNINEYCDLKCLNNHFYNI